MRQFLLVTVSLASLSFVPSAFAAPAEDAALNKEDAPIYSSFGNCVRTKWEGDKDVCAPKAAPAPKPAPVPVVAKPTPAPVLANITREQLTLYFDFNKSTLTTESTRKLDTIVDIINKSSEISEVKIHGFTDQFGTASYNDTLANNRAAAVKSYIDSKARLQTNNADIRGLGKASPEAQCASVKKRAAKITCMAAERRVEVEFVVKE